MKFSIVTCTLNSVSWLKENIESVIKQTLPDWEHIFIDGFSNDGTLKLIQEYQTRFPENVKWYQLPSRGISQAMNEGIKKTSGDYLIHLHADDYFYDHDVLKDAKAFLDKNNYDWIYGRINVVNGLGVSQGFFPKKKIWQNNSQDKIGKYLLKFYNYIPHQAVFIKKEVFDQFGLFDESLSSAMDPDLWLRIKNVTKWTFFDRIISGFSLHVDSQTASPRTRRENKINYSIVQRRYLNIFESCVARAIKWAIQIKQLK